MRDPTGVGVLQVSVPMNLVGGYTSDGSSIYTLRKVDGEWKIAQIDRRSAE